MGMTDAGLERLAEALKLPTLICLRCGHGPWYPRTENLPKVCPRCKSEKWNTPKEEAND